MSNCTHETVPTQFVEANGIRYAYDRPYSDLGPEPQAALRERLRLTLRANRYDPATGTLTIEPVRARAFEANEKHFAAVFSDGKAEYAIPRGTVSDPERLRQLSTFFLLDFMGISRLSPGRHHLLHEQLAA